MRSSCFVAAAAGSERERRNITSGATAENTASDAANASEAQDYGRQDETRQDKTRRAKPSTPHLAQPTEQDGQNTTVQDNDPRLGCIECWLWKTRQDKKDETQHRTSRATAEMPALDVCSETGHVTSVHSETRHFASRATAETPQWMQRMLRKCKIMEDKTREKRVEMHLEISHAEIDRENAAPQSEHLDQTHRPLPLPYEPLSVDTLFGENTCVRKHLCVKAPVCKRSCV